MIKNTDLTNKAIGNTLGVPIKRVQDFRKKTQGS